ncbi:hypothetical protein LP418_09070 [Nocardioides sp. B-3]|nr:hypothetical protein [Nocardioides sp. B-3]UUZ60860.1 hypothetical protein LP418_09070 [Nocardioides sp. B-3]
MVAGRRRQDRAGARGRHRQADARDGRPRSRGLRDREGPGDARGAAAAGARGQRQGRRRRGDPRQRPQRRRRRRRAGLPLVRPRAGDPGDGAGAEARRSRRARVELLRQEDPVGAQAGRRRRRRCRHRNRRRAGRRSISHEFSAESDLFGEIEHKTFSFWQDVDRDTLVDIVASRSYIASLPDDEREAGLDAVRALYDDYGRGHDGMQLPYVVECFRAKVIDQRDAATEVPSDASQEGPIVSDGTDTDMLLIDFR